jgi:hypothetical protein
MSNLAHDFLSSVPEWIADGYRMQSIYRVQVYGDDDCANGMGSCCTHWQILRWKRRHRGTRLYMLRGLSSELESILSVAVIECLQLLI